MAINATQSFNNGQRSAVDVDVAFAADNRSTLIHVKYPTMGSSF